MGTSARIAIVTLVVMAALAPLADERNARAEEPPPCPVVDVEYALAANLELTDTPMGQGNGVYAIGPGTAVVRYAGNDAKLAAYRMREAFRVDATAVFWKTHVTTDSWTTVAADACGVVANASLGGRTLTWNSDVKARTDGTVTCDGSLCGKFGAPPPGTTPLHIALHDVHFRPWAFSADMKTFAMPRTWISQSEMPKQTGFIFVSGREVRRTCVQPPACGR